jgi:alpha-tubulin suppressor-like RCC1 family protein
MHQLTPTQVGFSTDWQNISAGQYHVLATKTNGALWAWGNNGTGAIGNGNTTTVAAPIQVGSATNWSKISASTFASYAIKTDGTLWSWGYNDYGQLGVGDLVQKTVPVQVGEATNWQSISGSMSYYYAVAIKTDGSAWSWGINNFGVLGDGTKVNKLVPTAISCPNTLAAETFTNATISLYPNPSNGSFKIETTKNIQLIRAFDVLGNEIKLQTQPDNLYSINAKGLFLLQITFENDQIVTQKLIIQ